MATLPPLRRDPSLSVAAILCFALGIGANTSIFSVVNGVLFRPLPFDDSGRLVLIGEWLPRAGGENFGVISTAEFGDYQRLNGRIFAATGIYLQGESRGVAISGDGEPERVAGLHVSPSLFGTLGVPPSRGRAFNTGDDSTGGPAAVIISDALWRRRFSSREVVGQSVDVDGTPRTIVGILPPSFSFPLPGIGGEPADVFIPLRVTAEVEQSRGNSYETYRGRRSLVVVQVAFALVL